MVLSGGIRDNLSKLCDDVALLLVLAAPGDADTLLMVKQQLEQLHELAKREAGDSTEIVLFTLGLVQRCDEGPTQELLSYLSTGITSLAQAVEANDLTRLPGSSPSAEKAGYLATVVDDRLLTDLIETHTLMLDEFESGLMDFINGQSDGEESKKAAKRYLHNLKGDSGAVGLVDLERICHQLEDAIGVLPTENSIPLLISFREWVGQFFVSIVNKSGLVRSPEAFLKEIQTLSQDVASRKETIVEAVSVSETANPVQDASLQSYQLAGDLELFSDFLVEAEEHVLRVEEVCLESDGASPIELVDAIFRAVHSLKGGSAYFKFQEMTESSHYFENLLVQVRDGKRDFDDRLRTLALEYIDLQKLLLQKARVALTSGSPISTSAEFPEFMNSLKTYESSGCKGKVSSVSATTVQPLAAEEPVKVQPVPPTPPTTVPSASVAPASSSIPTISPKSDEQGDKLEVKSFVKVDTTRLDHLIDSVGEMVIYSAMLVRHCREHLGQNQPAMDAASRVEKFVRDLQDVAMSMRLVPIKGLFQKMSRLVWDTSKKLGKDIAFDMEGEDTELDRNLIDKLADPLMHMVRNALDHGVEGPDDRVAAGKARQGKVTLKAFHSGGSIHIVIVDDGRGIDCERVFAKAVEKGIISSGAQLSQNEIYQLLFAPGFSTAAQVTDISGRGVGMDVVKRNVESLRGRIHITSEKGKGSRFTVELPLTLALIDGIQVRVGEESFIIPSLSIVEFLRPQVGSINRPMEDCETFEFRGDSLPLFRLSHLFGIEGRTTCADDGTVVILESTGEYVAFMVDEIIGEYSTVIKGLGQLFADQRGMAGCAIMPNGDISLIVDVQSLIHFARESIKLERNRRMTHAAVSLVQ